MACSLTVRVVPQSGRSACTIDAQGNIKVYLLSAARDNMANCELIKLFSKLLRVPQRQITIASGATGRVKRMIIDANITEAQALQACGLGVQRALF